MWQLYRPVGRPRSRFHSLNEKISLSFLHTLENSPLDVLPEEQFYDDLNDDTIQEVYDKVQKNKKKLQTQISS